MRAAEPTANEDLSTIAEVIASSAIQSRIGFGAFRKYQTLFRRSLHLIAESCLFAPRDRGQDPYWTLDPEYIFFARERGTLNPAHFIRDSLTLPKSFDPACIWALFWAMAKCEHEFSRRYLPFWSHEERLTGHFVSQLCERIEEFSASWLALSASDDKQSVVDIWYADTATFGREKETGADFGLIIEARYSGKHELLKAARFQVKKVPSNNSARLDFDQTKALLDTPSLGYYLFYHGKDRQEWRRAPTVAPASAFTYDLSQVEKRIAEQTGPLDRNLGTHTTSAVDDKSYDFSIFLTFALADPGADFGAVAQTKRDAVRLLMGGSALSPPSRLMVISLGAPINPPDWLDALGENVRYFSQEEE